MNILQEADKLIHGDRNSQYGHPADNHGMTARLWSEYLGKDIDAEDVCFLNILQKISREVTSKSKKRDTIVDIAGYAGNVEMIRERQGATIPKSATSDSELLSHYIATTAATGVNYIHTDKGVVDLDGRCLYQIKDEQ